MSKQKYYVVWKGNNPGVYKSWEKCQDEIKNIKGALFKSFGDIEEAHKAYEMGYDEYKKNSVKDHVLDGPELNSISVDAASSGNPGIWNIKELTQRQKKFCLKWGHLIM